MAVQKIRTRQSAAPVVWFFLLWPYRVLVYMIWAALISARAVLFILIVTSTLIVPLYVLMSVSYFGMNIAAGQVEILESVDVLAGFFGSAYNDFIAEPYNNIADCYAGIVAWYNLTVAFVEAVIATIAQQFGVDLFAFALRSDISDLELLRLQMATAERLSREQKISPEASMNRAKIMTLAGRIAKEMVGLSREGRNERSKRLIGALCDILTYVIRFLIAVLDLFGDFFLTLMSAVIDLFITAAGSFSFSFVEAFVLVSFTVILDLIDPLGCFHPFSNLPESLALCICPHAYPNLASIPSEVYNIVAGCLCPGVDLEDGPVAILRQCLRVDFLQDLLSFISTLMSILWSVLSNIQSIAINTAGVVANVIGLKDEIGGLLGEIEDIICDIPFVCKRTTVTRIEHVAVAGRSETRLIHVNETTVVITDTRSGEEVYRYVRKSRYTNDEIEQMMDSLLSLLRLTDSQLDDLAQRMQQIQINAAAAREADEAVRSLYDAASLIIESRSAKGHGLANTLRGFVNTRIYTGMARASLFGNIFSGLFQDRLLDALVGPDENKRRQMREDLEIAPGWCSGRCRETYSYAVSGLTGLGRSYLAGLASIRYNHTAGQYDWWGHADFQADFAARGIDVLGVADSVIEASEYVSDFHAQSGGAGEQAVCVSADGTESPCCAAEDGSMTVACTESYSPGFEASPLRATHESQRAFSNAQARQVYRSARERGVRNAINVRAMLNPATLPEAIDEMLNTVPASADTILSEIEKIDEQVTAFALARDILAEHRSRGTSSETAHINTERLRELRGVLRADVKNLRSQTVVLPTSAEEAHTSHQRSVLFIGLTLVAAGTFVVGVQVSTFAVIAFAPVVALVLVALLPLFVVFLTACAEQVFSIFMTFAMGGKVTGIELLTPWIVKLGPYVAGSYFTGFSAASLGAALDEALDVGELELEYVAYEIVRKITSVVPRPGFSTGFPQPPHDPATGLPLTGFVDSILDVLAGNPKEACSTKASCTGNVYGCLCPDGRTATDEAECPGMSGTCQAVFYWYPKRLQPIDLSVTFSTSCEDLGWVHHNIAAYEGVPFWTRIGNRFTSAKRTLRYITNSASRGVFVPWIGVFGGIFGLVPFLSFIAHATFKWTFIVNIGSVVTRYFGTAMISVLEPNTNLIIVGGVATTLLDYLRFPNALPGGDKGSPTFIEGFCSFLNIPQAADIAYLALISIIGIFAVLQSGFLRFAYGFVIDFGFVWLNFWFMLVHYCINISLIEITKRRILSLEHARELARTPAGAALPESASAEDVMRHACAHALRSPNSALAREGLTSAARILEESHMADPVHFAVCRARSPWEFARVCWETRRDWA
jgi:hypothetical protein